MTLVRFLIALLLALFASGCDASERGEALPEPVSTPSSQLLKDQRVRMWPRSVQVEQGVEYAYETGHCGLTYDLDFDGSFWRAVNPNGRKEPPKFFINYDKGYITLVSEESASYESSTGEVVELRRIDGPIVIGGCG